MHTKNAILELVNQHRLIIHPFDIDQLGPNSYDVRLGGWIYRQYNPFNQVIDPYNREQVTRLFGDPIPYGVSFVIQPGETVLAHTEEFIGSVHDIVCMLHCRSSVARFGVDTNKAAGFGDVGYIGRWTMELTNNGRSPIQLYHRMRIAQFEFQPVFDALSVGDLYTRDHGGKYGNSTDSRFLLRDSEKILEATSDMINNWRPSDMLPKMWRDYDMLEIIRGRAELFK